MISQENRSKESIKLTEGLNLEQMVFQLYELVLELKQEQSKGTKVAKKVTKANKVEEKIK